jgi:hypothetical protein
VSPTVIVTLAYPPTWYTSEFWNTHEFDFVKADRPYDDKPKTRFVADAEATLGSILDVASEQLGLLPGPELKSRGVTKLSSYQQRMGFYRDVDETTFSMQEVYTWPDDLPVIQMDGTVETRPWREVTLMQALAASSLGLNDGDVLRPYICPSMRQGMPPEVAHLAQLSGDTFRTAYRAMPHVSNAIDDAVRVTFVVGVIHNIRRRWRERRHHD